jgi:hypothetical protein
MLTSGTIIRIVLLAIAALCLLLAIAAFVVDEPMGGISLLAVAVVLALFPLVGWALVGFNGEYMAYHPVSGKVDQIASRQIADGKGMSQRYVFTIGGQPYGVDDTRAALVKPGDTVSLNCVREFVWGSTNNGYACNWG